MKKQITIEGMTCHHCVMAVKKELTEADVTVLNAGIGFAEVEGGEAALADDRLAKIVTEAGYKFVKAENAN
jgi:copper chaperone